MPTTPRRDAFVAAARAAAALLADPAVAAYWGGPSALAEFRVSGLAGHLSSQIRYVSAFLAEPDPGGRPEGLSAHYAAADWIGAAVDDEANVSTRVNGERAAAAGAAALAGEVSGLVDALLPVLAAAPEDRRVRLPWADRVLTLDDFLLTRTMEIVVHCDDLAVSVGVPTPDIPNEATGPVVGLLADISVQRHGALPLLRALSRTERATGSIAAF